MLEFSNKYKILNLSNVNIYDPPTILYSKQFVYLFFLSKTNFANQLNQTSLLHRIKNYVFTC